MKQHIDRYFSISARGSTVPREILGGLTTFATMSYIVFVQPTVLSIAGMDFGAVVVATCLSSAIACFLMGFLAHYPFALAPGMGQNFLFVFTVCLGMGFDWRNALSLVLFSGIIFVVLSLFRVRERVLRILPDCLKDSIGPAIGLFIAYVGFQWSGIVVLNSATMTSLGDFRAGAPLIALAGVLIMGGMLARNLRGGIFVGILATLGLGLLTGVIPLEAESPRLSAEAMFQFRLDQVIARWDEALIAILLFFFLDLFDTVGTLVGVSSQAGFLRKDGSLPRAGRAFLADALGTCAGACCGTSTITSYIESATGVAAGARTGLAAITTGLCFLGAMVLAPLAALVGTNVGPAYYAALGIEGAMVAMYPAVAPALIVVGFLMLRPLARVNWDDVTESMPAFFTIAMMMFGFGITEGVACGCITFAAIKLVSGRGREVHPVMYGIAGALVLRYAFLVGS